MQIAELFVSLGIKGSEKTIAAVTNVKAGLGQVASTSLEAKAAIVGAMYALQHFMSESAVRGTVLSNFNAQTDISVKQLQEWEYAASRAGASNEEFLGTVKTVYDKIAQIKLNKGTPEYLGILANHVAGFDIKKAYDVKTGAFYILEQLQKLAQLKNLSKDIINQVISSFGVSDNVKSALFKNEFTPQNFKKAPTYSEKEVETLNKVNILWSDIGRKIQMAFGHFTALHGTQLAGDISKIVTEVFKFITALNRLSEKLVIFKIIGESFKVWTESLNGLTDLINRFFPKNEKEKLKSEKNLEKNPLVIGTNLLKEEASSKLKLYEQEFKTYSFSIFQGIKEQFNSIFKGFNLFSDLNQKDYNSKENKEIRDKRYTEHFKDNDIKGPLQLLLEIFINFIKENKNNNENYQNPQLNSKYYAEPKVPVINNNNHSGKIQNIEINQSLNFQHEGKEHHLTKDSVNKAVRDAWKQLSVQSQGA